MSEREPNTEPAPQSGDVSAVELGSAPPSRSENAVAADSDARMLAWTNGMRTAKASGAFGDYVTDEESCDRVIAGWRRAYMRGMITLAQFEEHVETALRQYYERSRLT